MGSLNCFSAELCNELWPLVHRNPVLRVPQNEGGVLASIESGMVIHDRRYEGNLVHLSVTGPASLVGRLREYRLRDR